MSDSGSFKIVGADLLKQLLEQFPDNVQKRAVNTGLGKAGGRLRTYLRRAAPTQSGTLKKSIGIKRDRKTGKVKVGLMTRYYYKTLDFTTKRGPPLRPYFENVWDSKREEITQMILDETIKAISAEAGKIYARSKSSK